MTDEAKKIALENTEVPLNFRLLGRMPSVFANNLLIQANSESVLVSFFETILPPKLELTPEDIQELKEVGILAECVARITMPPQAFIQAAEAMGRVAATVRASIAGKEGKNAEL